MAILDGELFEVRKKHVMTKPLDSLQDVLHAFFECPACKQGSVSINLLHGNIQGVMNDMPGFVKLVVANPSRLIANATTTRCACGAISRLASVVLCRTNPTRGNDFHLRVKLGDAIDLDAAMLMLDGRYVPVPAATLSRALGL